MTRIGSGNAQTSWSASSPRCSRLRRLCPARSVRLRPDVGAPTLVVVISVDQFSADLFDEYRPHFTGGLARLANGTAFRNGYQAHAATETCPGHSTILTGSHPTHTGIIGNTWVDQSLSRSDKTVYCAEDERVPGSSTTELHGFVHALATCRRSATSSSSGRRRA